MRNYPELHYGTEQEGVMGGATGSNSDVAPRTHG
jgi:hypothetical protein